MNPQQVASLTVRLGEHNIKQSGETNTYETKVARVVRHKGFSSQTLVREMPYAFSNQTLSNPTCMYVYS